MTNEEYLFSDYDMSASIDNKIEELNDAVGSLGFSYQDKFEDFFSDEEDVIDGNGYQFIGDDKTGEQNFGVVMVGFLEDGGYLIVGDIFVAEKECLDQSLEGGRASTLEDAVEIFKDMQDQVDESNQVYNE